MAIHPTKIGFDIDGVVADTMEAFSRIANRHGYKILPSDITRFEVEKCLDMDPLLIEKIFAQLMEDPLKAGLRPMRYAVNVLREFSRRGNIAFVTARPDKRPIERWLYSVLGEETFCKVHLIATGNHDSKATYIKKLGLHYFVDDRAQTCDILEKEGITPIVYRQPWNRNSNGHRAVSNWLSIRSLCHEKLDS